MPHSTKNGMTLNDYIQLMKDPANFDENDFEDEEPIPSSGSESDDQEFSKFE